jgi:hypothetical protein
MSTSSHAQPPRTPINGVSKDLALTAAMPRYQLERATHFGLGLPTSTKERLILRFRASALCGHGVGLVSTELPPALASPGVDGTEWRFFMGKLSHEVQPLSLCGGCIIASLIPHLWPLTLLPYCCCQARYHSALARWLAELNRSVLEPRGLFAALQTAEVRAHCGSLAPGITDETASWLAVSLKPSDAARLQREPMLWTSGSCSPCAGDGTLVPHPAPYCVATGYCGVPCAV